LQSIHRADSLEPNSNQAARRKPHLKRLGVLLLLLLALAFALRALFFTGPAAPPMALPDARIVDMHVHLAGYGNGGSGCYVSPRLRDNYRFDFYLKGFDTSRAELERYGDQVVVDRIAAKLKASRHVDAAVLLALDGVIDAGGELDRVRTEIYIPNDYVARQVRRYPDVFFFGASVNPYRKDALQRLELAKQQGAVLVKWIPNIQYIDPADPRLVPFYRKLRELNLPLLSHAGQDRSFSSAQDAYGDPERLRLPLSLGVTVIAAHIATTGSSAGEDNFQRILPMFSQYPNLYADISSLTQLNKLGFLNQALRAPQLKGRLLYGTDFPLSDMVLTSAWYFPLNLTLAEMWAIQAIPNHWDRDVALKQALGVSPDVFARSAEILGISP
jgi:predicted TIM-barrel fold metal-dependent hydrolase